MVKTIAMIVLLVGPCLSGAYPPPPDSPLYVPPPQFIDPNTDDPNSANRLLQGIWENSSDTDHFAFEIKLLKFRVLRPNCDWLHWEWLTATDELIDGKLVLTKFTIRVVAESGDRACLEVPMPVYVVFVSPPKYDVAKVALGVGWDNERDLLMIRNTR